MSTQSHPVGNCFLSLLLSTISPPVPVTVPTMDIFHLPALHGAVMRAGLELVTLFTSNRPPGLSTPPASISGSPVEGSSHSNRRCTTNSAAPVQVQSSVPVTYSDRFARPCSVWQPPGASAGADCCGLPPGAGLAAEADDFGGGAAGPD